MLSIVFTLASVFQLSRPAEPLKNVFASSSLSAAMKVFPGGVDERRQYLTAITGSHLAEHSAKYP